MTTSRYHLKICTQIRKNLLQHNKNSNEFALIIQCCHAPLFPPQPPPPPPSTTLQHLSYSCHYRIQLNYHHKLKVQVHHRRVSCVLRCQLVIYHGSHRLAGYFIRFLCFSYNCDKTLSIMMMMMWRNCESQLDKYRTELFLSYLNFSISYKIFI